MHSHSAPFNRRYLPLVPVLLLAACCISTLLFWLKGTTNDDGSPASYVLTAKHYGAFTATSACLVSFLLLRNYFKYVFALTLLLGTLGLINFTIDEIRLSIGFDSLSIGISPVLLLVGLITYGLYSSRVNAKLLALVAPSEEKVAKARQQEIAVFEERFARKSTEELTQIITENKVVPAAIAAARQLLSQRLSN